MADTGPEIIPRFGRRSRTAESAARAYVQPTDDSYRRAGAGHRRSMRCCGSIRRATGSIAPTTPLAARDAERELLRAELKSQASRERQAARDLDRRLDALEDVPKQLRGAGALGRGAARPRRRAGARLVARRSVVSAGAGAAPARAGSRRPDGHRRAGIRGCSPGIAARPVVSRRCGSRSQASCRRCAPCVSPTRPASWRARQRRRERAAHLPVKGILATERRTPDRARCPKACSLAPGPCRATRSRISSSCAKWTTGPAAS